MSFPKKYLEITNKYPHVQILIVTKYFNPEETEKIAKLIQDNNLTNVCLAENRIQQSIDKIITLNKFRSYFIGPLQSNKVKKAVEIFDVIESVSNLKLAKQISKEAKKQNKIQNIYLQINISWEEQKFWFKPWDFFNYFCEIIKLKNINPIWIMAIASKWEALKNEDEFKKMKITFDKLKKKYNKIKYLSMWMSQDFELAIACWANEVRLWKILF